MWILFYYSDKIKIVKQRSMCFCFLLLILLLLISLLKKRYWMCSFYVGHVPCAWTNIISLYSAFNWLITQLCVFYGMCNFLRCDMLLPNHFFYSVLTFFSLFRPSVRPSIHPAIDVTLHTCIQKDDLSFCNDCSRCANIWV